MYHCFNLIGLFGIGIQNRAHVINKLENDKSGFLGGGGCPSNLNFYLFQKKIIEYLVFKLEKKQMWTPFWGYILQC